MTVGEAQKAAEMVDQCERESNDIWGCSIEPELTGTIEVLLIVTGAKSKYMLDARGTAGKITQALEKFVPVCAYSGTSAVPAAETANEDG